MVTENTAAKSHFACFRLMIFLLCSLLKERQIVQPPLWYRKEDLTPTRLITQCGKRPPRRMFPSKRHLLRRFHCSVKNASKQSLLTRVITQVPGSLLLKRHSPPLRKFWDAVLIKL